MTTTYPGEATATATTNDGVIVTASATATSTISENDANDLAYNLAYEAAETQANVLDQGVAISEIAQNTYKWETRKVETGTSWKSVCYGNGVFVAVGSDVVGTRYIMTSQDGFNWIDRQGPANIVWQAVCYGNGLFIAVPDNDKIIMTSPDGITWTSRNIPYNTNVQFTSICYGNGWFVAVTNTDSKDGFNIIFRSPDGINWTEIVTNFSFTLNSICYGERSFVAVTSDRKYAISYDNGLNWGNGDIYTNDSKQYYWQSVCFGNGLFVAVNSNSGIYSDPNDVAIAYSSNGKDWTGVKDTILFAQWFSVCYGKGAFFAISKYDKNNTYLPIIMASLDGMEWKVIVSIEDDDSNYKQPWSSICYGNGLCVAVSGSDGSGYPVLTTGKQTINPEFAIQPFLAGGDGNIVTYPGFGGNLDISGNVDIGGNVTIGNIVNPEERDAPLVVAARGGTDPNENGLYIYNESTSGTEDNPVHAICGIRTNYLSGDTNSIGSAFTSYDILGRGGWSTGVTTDLTYRIVPYWDTLRGVPAALTADYYNSNITIGKNLNIAKGQYIEFGYNVTKEVNAGKVGYQVFSSGLDIVGAGTSGTYRTITLWDDVTINRSLRYPGQICGWYNDDEFSAEGPRYFVMSSLFTMNGAGSGGDDFWFILPGYKFVLYNSDGYNTTIDLNLDNYSGTSVTCVKNTTGQRARSFKVYYLNDSNEITINGLSNSFK